MGSSGEMGDGLHVLSRPRFSLTSCDCGDWWQHLGGAARNLGSPVTSDSLVRTPSPVPAFRAPWKESVGSPEVTASEQDP